MHPQPPTLMDQALRARRQEERYQLLTEDIGNNDNNLVDLWIQEQVGSPGAAALGPPDLSANTLLAATAQLATPGLYGLGEPTLSHPTGDADGMIHWLRAAGYWTRMQFVQRMVTGIGDWVLHFEVQGGKLCIHNAHPWRLWTRCSPHDPTDVQEIRWLRCRYAPDGSMAWYWDVYRLDGPDGPVFQVIDTTEAMSDWSNIYIQSGDTYAPPGGLRGPAYPYRRPDGAPFLPFQFYSDCDDGQLWHDNARRGATRGALNSITLSTYQLRALFSAAMPPAIAVNLQQPAAQVVNIGGANNQGATTAASLPSIPGTILFTQTVSPDVQGSIQQLSVGGNLQALNTGVDNYNAAQFSRLGIASDDLKRDSANPTSAAALSISRAGKRERALQVRPFFQRCDLAAIEIAASLAALSGVATWPLTGWSIAYQAIPLSPEEAQAGRDDLTWKQEQKLISRIDAYQAAFPGTTRQEAIDALKRVQADEAELAQASPAIAGQEPAIAGQASEVETEDMGEAEAPEAETETEAPEMDLDEEAMLELIDEAEALIESGNPEEARLALAELRGIVRADILESESESDA